MTEYDRVCEQIKLPPEQFDKLIDAGSAPPRPLSVKLKEALRRLDEEGLTWTK